MNDLATVPNNENRNGRQIMPFAEAVPALRDPYGRLSVYGGSVAEESELSSVNLFEYWRILYKRKWLILGSAAAFVILATVKMLMATPAYTSTVRLQIDPPAKVVEGGNTDSDFNDYQFMQTQYQLLESRTMAERVASTLKLEKGAIGGVSVSPVTEFALG